MDNVKRYEMGIFEDDGDPVECSDGDYVLFSDYEALRDRFRRACQTEQVEKLVTALESILLIPLGGMDFTSDKKYFKHSHDLNQKIAKQALAEFRGTDE